VKAAQYDQRTEDQDTLFHRKAGPITKRLARRRRWGADRLHGVSEMRTNTPEVTRAPSSSSAGAPSSGDSRLPWSLRRMCANVRGLRRRHLAVLLLLEE
jgi:hypothetical protein